MSQHHKWTRSFARLNADFKAESKAADAACWLCGQAIDYEAPHDDYGKDDRFQLDRYYPAASHPELSEDPANFRPLHAGCNRERSDNAPMPNLGCLSRPWQG